MRPGSVGRSDSVTPRRRSAVGRTSTAWAATAFLLTATLTMAMPQRARAQELDPSTDALLQLSDAASVLAGVREEVGRTLLALGVEPTQAQNAVLDRFLAVDPLMQIMGMELQRLGDMEMRAAAARLLETGAITRADSLRDAAPPSLPLNEYVAGLEDHPPTQARVQIMNQVVAGQAAGPAQVLLAERIREASHRMARAMGAAVEPFAPLTQGDWVTRAEEAHRETLISFLHQYQNVPDELLEARVQDWITQAGAWLSEAYSVASAEAVLMAADRAVAALGGN